MGGKYMHCVCMHIRWWEAFLDVVGVPGPRAPAPGPPKRTPAHDGARALRLPLARAGRTLCARAGRAARARRKRAPRERARRAPAGASGATPSIRTQSRPAGTRSSSRKRLVCQIEPSGAATLKGGFRGACFREAPRGGRAETGHHKPLSASNE